MKRLSNSPVWPNTRFSTTAASNTPCAVLRRGQFIQAEGEKYQ
jgi:hypothetical protein